MVELKGAGSSTSQNLSREIIAVLDKYKIALTQIVPITSDNGANMIKTSKIYSEMHMSDDDIDEVCIKDNIEYTKPVFWTKKLKNYLNWIVQLDGDQHIIWLTYSIKRKLY